MSLCLRYARRCLCSVPYQNHLKSIQKALAANNTPIAPAATTQTPRTSAAPQSPTGLEARRIEPSTMCGASNAKAARILAGAHTPEKKHSSRFWSPHCSPRIPTPRVPTAAPKASKCTETLFPAWPWPSSMNTLGSLPHKRAMRPPSTADARAANEMHRREVTTSAATTVSLGRNERRWQAMARKARHLPSAAAASAQESPARSRQHRRAPPRPVPLLRPPLRVGGGSATARAGQRSKATATEARATASARPRSSRGTSPDRLATTTQAPAAAATAREAHASSRPSHRRRQPAWRSASGTEAKPARAGA
mmetsp:Transcript_113037/g.314606  ORF Transcript_113037/g.314606 Transcript_113037/m.314606 type:complete len:309 (+) Transcript_113037:357-1283(+)